MQPDRRRAALEVALCTTRDFDGASVTTRTPGEARTRRARALDACCARAHWARAAPSRTGGAWHRAACLRSAPLPSKRRASERTVRSKRRASSACCTRSETTTFARGVGSNARSASRETREHPYRAATSRACGIMKRAAHSRRSRRCGETPNAAGAAAPRLWPRPAGWCTSGRPRDDCVRRNRQRRPVRAARTPVLDPAASSRRAAHLGTPVTTPDVQ